MAHLQLEFYITNCHAHPRCEFNPFEPASIDHETVPAAKVDERIAVLGTDELGVVSRNGQTRQNEVVSRAATDGERRMGYLDGSTRRKKEQQIALSRQAPGGAGGWGRHAVLRISESRRNGDGTLGDIGRSPEPDQPVSEARKIAAPLEVVEERVYFFPKALEGRGKLAVVIWMHGDANVVRGDRILDLLSDNLFDGAQDLQGVE
jgi:hypothetical protein